MPRKRKKTPAKKKARKEKPRRQKVKVPVGMMTVPDAADFLYMTQSGVGNALKRGDVTGKKIGRRVFVSRETVKAFHKRRMDFYFPKPKTQKQLDEEFLQRLWENDPD